MSIYMLLMRGLLIRHIGEDIVGISDMIIAALSFLNIAEAGFQTAIVSRLYAPVKSGDTSLVSRYLRVLHYYYISLSILYLLVASLFFLYVEMVEFKYDGYDDLFSLYFSIAFLQISTLYSSHIRAVFYVFKKEYVYHELDIISYILLGGGAYFIIMSGGEFYEFFLLAGFRALGVYFLLSVYSSRFFSEFLGASFDYDLFKKTLSDIKHLFIGSVSGVVFLGWVTISLGLFSNVANLAVYASFIMVANVIKKFSTSIFSISKVVIGTSLANLSKKEFNIKAVNQFYKTRLLWLFIIFCTIPAFFYFVDSFVSIWLSVDVSVSYFFVTFLTIELYICLAMSVNGDFLVALGRFKHSQLSDTVALLLCLVFSLIGGYLFGADGIIFGVVFSRLAQWTLKSYFVFIFVFRTSLHVWSSFIVKEFFLMILVFLFSFIFQYVDFLDKKDVFSLFLGVILLFFLSSVFFFLIFRNNEDLPMFKVWRK